MSKKKKVIWVLPVVILIIVAIAGCGSQKGQEGTYEDEGYANEATVNDEPKVDMALGTQPTRENKVEEEESLSVSILSITSPASPGGTPVIVFARTEPGAICEIEVGYDGGENEATALIPKQAQENGLVSWTWSIDPSTPFGKYPVTVTAKKSDGSGQPVSAVEDIEIKSAEECKK